MSELKSGDKIAVVNGRVIREFDWRNHENLLPIPQMWGAASKLSEAVSGTLAKVRELEGSRDFTPAGRRNALLAWIRDAAAPRLRDARANVRAAEAAVANIRSGMTGPAIDKSDLAGAVRRVEIRTWLRGLDDGKRTSMLTLVDQLEPEIAAAITEVPHELSGVTRDQRERLRERAMAVRYSADVARIDKISAAAAALDDHVRLATETLVKVAGVSANELAEMAGEPSLAERLDEMLAAE